MGDELGASEGCAGADAQQKSKPGWVGVECGVGQVEQVRYGLERGAEAAEVVAAALDEAGQLFDLR